MSDFVRGMVCGGFVSIVAIFFIVIFGTQVKWWIEDYIREQIDKRKKCTVYN